MYAGKRYESTRQAAQAEGRSRAQILRDLATTSRPDIYSLEREESPFGAIPIFGQKDHSPSFLFNSVAECVEAGYRCCCFCCFIFAYPSKK